MTDRNRYFERRAPRACWAACLLGLALTAFAQDPPPAGDADTAGPAAAETPDGPGAGTPERDSPEASGDTGELAVEPAERFDPTEEVDEDYSIPFPTDI